LPQQRKERVVTPNTLCLLQKDHERAYGTALGVRRKKKEREEFI